MASHNNSDSDSTEVSDYSDEYSCESDVTEEIEGEDTLHVFGILEK